MTGTGEASSAEGFLPITIMNPCFELDRRGLPVRRTPFLFLPSQLMCRKALPMGETGRSLGDAGSHQLVLA